MTPFPGCAAPAVDGATFGVETAMRSPRAISNAELASEISSIEFIHRGRLTLCLMALRNGVVVVGESQALAGPHDPKVGEAVSQLNARERAMALIAFSRLQGAS